MAYLTDEELNDGSPASMKGGETRKLIAIRYAPFQSKAGKTIPKHIFKDAESGQEVELVGYAIHDAIKRLNDQVVPEVTVLKVESLDNGTQYPDFKVELDGPGF